MNGVRVNDKLENFHATLISELDKIAPERLVPISTKQVINIAWMTPGLNRCSKKRLDLYKKSLNGKEVDIIKYRQIRDLLKKVKRARHFSYFNDKCIEFKNNSKKLWEMVNNIIGKTNDKCNIISKLKIDGIECNNSSLIVNKLANHFGSIGKSCANKIPKSVTSIESYLNIIKTNKKSLYLQLVTMIEST